MSDPVRDLRDEVTALRAELDVNDARIQARFDRIEADIDRLEQADKSFAARSWGVVMLVLTAGAGGIVAILTRSNA